MIDEPIEIELPICIRLPKVLDTRDLHPIFVALYERLEVLGYDVFHHMPLGTTKWHLVNTHVHASNYNPHLLIGFKRDYLKKVSSEEGHFVDIWDSDGAKLLCNTYYPKLDEKLLKILFKRLEETGAIGIIANRMRDEINNAERKA